MGRLEEQEEEDLLVEVQPSRHLLRGVGAPNHEAHADAEKQRRARLVQPPNAVVLDDETDDERARQDTSWSRKALFFSTSCSDSGAADGRRRTRPPSGPTGVSSARAAVPPQTRLRLVFASPEERSRQPWEASSRGRQNRSQHDRKLSWHILAIDAYGIGARG